MEVKETSVLITPIPPPLATSSTKPSSRTCCLDRGVKFLKHKPALLWFLLLLRMAKLSWDVYLNYRQWHLFLVNVQPPAGMADLMTGEEYDKARARALVWHLLMGLGLLTEAIFTVAIVLCDLLPWVWGMLGLVLDVCHSCVATFCRRVHSSRHDLGSSYSAGEMEKSVLLITLLAPFSVLIPLFSLSLSILKLIILCVLFSCVLALQTATTISILQRGSISMKWLYVWLIFAVQPLIFIDVVYPLFDSSTTLPNSQLKQDIQNFATQFDFPLDKVFLTKDNAIFKRSSAYYSGLWLNQRVVFTESMIGRAPEFRRPNCTMKELANHEILAIFGHELGHWDQSHLLHRVLLSEVNLIVLLIIFAYFYRKKCIYHTFGFRTDRPLIIGALVIVYFIAVPYTELMSLVTFWMRQREEYAADKFAAGLGLGKSLCSALTKLGAGVGMPMDDFLYSIFHQTHPSLWNRCEALKKTY